MASFAPPTRPVSASPKMRPHRTRAIILAAAREVFHRRPAQTVSVDMIAKHAGLTRRTIYNQFGDAQSLFRATREELLLEVVRLLPMEVPGDMLPRAALQSYCVLISNAFHDPRYNELIGSIIRDSEFEPWLVDAFERHIRLPIRRCLETYFLALRVHDATSTFDVQVAARSLLRSLEAVAMSNLLSKGEGLHANKLGDCSGELINGFLSRLVPMQQVHFG